MAENLKWIANLTMQDFFDGKSCQEVWAKTKNYM